MLCLVTVRFAYQAFQSMSHLAVAMPPKIYSELLEAFKILGLVVLPLTGVLFLLLALFLFRLPRLIEKESSGKSPGGSSH